MKLTNLILALTTITLGCAAGSDANVEQSNRALDNAEVYYSVQHDTRRCVSPLCGGDFLTALNQDSTVCADGKSAARCYVAEAHAATPILEQAFRSGEDVIVRGHIEAKLFGSFGNLGSLVIDEVWMPEANDKVEGTGTFFTVRQDLRECVFPACGGWFASALNQTVTHCAGGQDAGACYASLLIGPDADVQAAHQNQVVIVRGDLKQGREGGVDVLSAVWTRAE
jgi:hypothetical protein